jgi:hypothetical protein
MAEKGEKIYSTLDKKAEYLQELGKNSTKMILFTLMFLLIFVIITLFIFSNNYSLTFPLLISIIGMFISLAMLITFSKWYLTAKKNIEIGQVGLKINKDGIYFGKHLLTEKFDFSDINFIFIGKDKFGVTLLLIPKSAQKITVTNKMLENPDLFIEEVKKLKKDLKIYPSDNLVDIQSLIKILKKYGVKLYYGIKGKEKIREL